MTDRTCKDCGVTKPLNKENFGHTPNGNFRGQCRACMRGVVAKHSKDNPDLVEDRADNRRARESRSTRDYHPETLKFQLARTQRNNCFYCKQTVQNLDAVGELDHMTPISKSGPDIRANIVLSCYQCNKEKHHKTVDEYRAWKIRNGEEVNF